MKLAILLPGYLDSPDYLHMITFEKGLTSLGYTVERMDLGNLWETGDPKDYTVTKFIDQIQTKINQYQNQQPEEVLLLGHSRGGFTAIIAGNRLPAVTKIIAICPPPDIKASVHKWSKNGSRTSQRDVPNKPDQFRDFNIPYEYVTDSLKYSAIEEAKTITKPLMIFIALNDEVVDPLLAEKIVASALNPYVICQPNMGHDFRNSQADCDIVMNHISTFLGN